MQITVAIKLDFPQTDMKASSSIIQLPKDQDMDNQTTMVDQVSLRPTRVVVEGSFSSENAKK